MKTLIEASIFFLLTDLLIFLLYYFLYLKRKYKEYMGLKKSKKKKKSVLEIMEIVYLSGRFKLDLEKVNLLYCIRWIAVIDAFIIALTGTFIYYLPFHIAWRLMIGFVMVFLLIYAIYEIFGRILIKKGWSKNEYKRNRK